MPDDEVLVRSNQWFAEEAGGQGGGSNFLGDSKKA